jgi:membrane protease subunit (stomatin/prohibitin family)
MVKFVRSLRHQWRLFFGNSDVGFVDMAANQLEFSKKLQEFLQDEFDNYGLELEKFLVQSISLPQELQDKLDKKASMNMVGDLQKYAQFEAADNIGTAAANPGGIAGAGVGVGAGVAIGQTMANALGAGGGAAAAPATAEDPIAMLEKLADLHKKGILSDDEFSAKKTELLAKIK